MCCCVDRIDGSSQKGMAARLSWRLTAPTLNCKKKLVGAQHFQPAFQQAKQMTDIRSLNCVAAPPRRDCAAAAAAGSLRFLAAVRAQPPSGIGSAELATPKFSRSNIWPPAAHLQAHQCDTLSANTCAKATMAAVMSRISMEKKFVPMDT